MKATQTIMGMPISIEALGAQVSESVLDEVFSYFRHVDAVFSTYKPGSEISRLNRGELRLADASKEVREVLRQCDKLKRLTDGFFDIHYRGPKGTGSIDPSGYVKGWAIRNAAALLDARHISRYCVDAGGDIQVRGQGPSDGPWRIGIKHPLEPTKLAKILYVSDGAVATSGIYERGRHIYNPHTGKEVADPLSLTVVGAGAVIDRVDALATAAFCMGREGMGFLQRQGYEAMLITPDAQVLQTLGFSHYETRP